MALITAPRTVNPRLGAYYGIFLSALAALALMTLILAGLGVDARVLSLAMMIGPICLYAAIGVATRTEDAFDFFAAGRRVPAFFNGLVLGHDGFWRHGLRGA